MRISSSTRKTVALLDKVKHRRELGIFKVEGTKCVLDTLGNFDCRCLIATDAWLEIHQDYIPIDTVIFTASADDMQRITHLSTAPEVVAVYSLPQYEFTPNILHSGITIALDGIQDPGNLGTILRLADWFGIYDIICSTNTVDVFNSKCIMATMGAISRVRVHYCNLSERLNSIGNCRVDIYGTFMSGENIFDAELSEPAIIIFGNEGNGISDNVAATVNRRITIPSFANGSSGSESLNVAMAASITISQFRCRNFYGKN